MHPHNALLIGISGPSSSGKTTLARLLRDIYPNVFILHEDDFYKADVDIPINQNAGVADWDCLEALDLPAFEDALRYIRTNGMPPSSLVSKEDKNAVGSVEVDKKVVDDLHWQASRWMFADVPPIAIVDGFLLYSEEMKNIRDLFDVKLFLRMDYATTKQRRENRNGYVTTEGFWEDPPGYVDKVVWPNYVKDHRFLFENDDVESQYRREVLDELKISGMPAELRGNMTALVQWAYKVVEDAMEGIRG